MWFDDSPTNQVVGTIFIVGEAAGCIGGNLWNVVASPPLEKGDLGGFNKPLKSPLSFLFQVPASA